MSSGRDRERDRRAQAASARTNEYFVPKDGIDREVITADICRYLGNDALVRPGNYEVSRCSLTKLSSVSNTRLIMRRTRRLVKAGYFITAYRNLTTVISHPEQLFIQDTH
jgi:D-serine deaminase-like pyridoxal phosphate-dependent protein